MTSLGWKKSKNEVPFVSRNGKLQLRQLGILTDFHKLLDKNVLVK